MKLQCALADENYKYEHGIYRKDIAMEELEIKQQELALETGRNDWAAFQLLLKSDEDFTLSLKENPVFSPRGPLENVRLQIEFSSLPEAEISMFPVGLVEDDDRRFKSDILLENDTVHVERLVVQPIWMEITVPTGAAPGKYEGEVLVYRHRMFENEELMTSLRFTVEVLDVVLHPPGQNAFNLDLWLHMANIARKHEAVLWSDSHFEILEHYVKSLSQLGQKSVMAIVSEIPWIGQRCYKNTNYLSDLFEYSMLKVKKNRSGEYIIDFSVLERYIMLCFKYGISDEIEVHGLLHIWTSSCDGYGNLIDDYPDAIRVRYYDEADKCYKYMRSGKEIREYIRSIETFFIRKGWIDKVRITADEPGDMPLYQKCISELKQAAPLMKVKIIIGHRAFLDHLDYYREENMDLVVLFDIACEKWEAVAEGRKKLNGQLSFYVCCSPDKPNTFISSPLLECRLMGILAAFMEFDGFVRWNYTVWPEKPRERISYKYPVWKAGDTNFVYPSNNGRPLLTLRYKNLKRGIEDFELIRRVKMSCPDNKELLGRIKDTIFRCRDWTQYPPGKKKNAEELYSLDYNDYRVARRMLLKALSSDECRREQA